MDLSRSVLLKIGWFKFNISVEGGADKRASIFLKLKKITSKFSKERQRVIFLRPYKAQVQ